MNTVEKRWLILCTRSIRKNFLIIIRKNGKSNTNRILRKLMLKMMQLYVMLQLGTGLLCLFFNYYAMHRYTNYVHGIGNGNSRKDIPCPVTVGSYLLTINAVLLISTLSFKYLFLRCADSLNFHLYITTVQ